MTMELPLHSTKPLVEFIEGMTGKRKRMLVATLGLGVLVKLRHSSWTAAEQDRSVVGKKKLAITQNINWACSNEYLVGRRQRGWTSPRVVRLTPRGEQVASRLTVDMQLHCPECDTRELECCEEAGLVVGIGCAACQGMFEPKVVARHYLERKHS